MNSKQKMENGFTLIELLVVVLIIGILSAIALPQYQKAVERSKMVEGQQWVRTIGQALNMFYLEHGTNATSFDQLDIKIPSTSTTAADWMSPSRTGIGILGARILSKDWAVGFVTNAELGTLILAWRLTGPWKDSPNGFAVTVNYAGEKDMQLYCVEYYSGGYCRERFGELPTSSIGFASAYFRRL